MYQRRARLFAETDHRHLRHARLDRPFEAGVRFDPVHRQKSVSRSGVGVEVYRQSVVGVSDDDRVHRGANLGANGFFGDAQRGQHRPLSLGGGATMRPHRRNDKRLCPERSQGVDRAANQSNLLSEPARPGPDRNGHAGRNDVVIRGNHSIEGGLINVGHRRRSWHSKRQLKQGRNSQRSLKGQLNPTNQLFPRHEESLRQLISHRTRARSACARHHST